MQVKVYFKDNTVTEIPEEALVNTERLLQDKISKVEYLQGDFDFVNQLAKKQLAEIEAREKAKVQETPVAIQTASEPKRRGRKPNKI